MQKRKLFRVFMLVWVFSLVTSLAIVYGGGLGFVITQNGGGSSDRVTYINLGQVGDPVITLDGNVVSSGNTFTVPYDGKLTIICTVTSPHTKIPSMALFDITDIIHPLDSGIQTFRLGKHIQSVEVNWNELKKDDTKVQFRFWGTIDSITYYSGGTLFFTLLRGPKPVSTTPTTTPPTPTTPEPVPDTTPIAGFPPPHLVPEYQEMMKTGYAMVIVVIHIIILPIGIFVIARRKN